MTILWRLWRTIKFHLWVARKLAELYGSTQAKRWREQEKADTRRMWKVLREEFDNLDP